MKTRMIQYLLYHQRMIPVGVQGLASFLASLTATDWRLTGLEFSIMILLLLMAKYCRPTKGRCYTTSPTTYLGLEGYGISRRRVR